MYELNPKEFNDLDEGDVQETWLNIISLNEYEKEVNKEYNKSTLVVKKEVLIKSLVEFLEEINIVLEKYHNIIHLKLLDSISTMYDVHHVKGLEQYAPNHLMLDIQHVIGL